MKTNNYEFYEVMEEVRIEFEDIAALNNHYNYAFTYHPEMDTYSIFAVKDNYERVIIVEPEEQASLSPEELEEKIDINDFSQCIFVKLGQNIEVIRQAIKFLFDREDWRAEIKADRTITEKMYNEHCAFFEKVAKKNGYSFLHTEHKNNTFICSAQKEHCIKTIIVYGNNGLSLSEENIADMIDAENFGVSVRKYTLEIYNNQATFERAVNIMFHENVEYMMPVQKTGKATC